MASATQAVASGRYQGVETGEILVFILDTKTGKVKVCTPNECTALPDK